ncbi:MAG TPA: ATP-binding cassette domain-containing protein [Trebonia sp.]
MLVAESVCVTFDKLKAVDNVSVTIPDAAVLGLAGPNGSGKSTLLNAMCGLVPAEGQLSLDGQPLAFGNPQKIRKSGVLRTYQTPQMVASLTCLENVLLSDPDRRATDVVSAVVARPMMWRAERARWDRARAAMASVGLVGKEHEVLGSLSYGTRRLVELARAVNGKPKVVLLDEPSAGLNDSETEQFADLLRALPAQGISLLIVDHKIDFLDSICAEIMVLMLGKVIAQGEPSAVWADKRVAEAYLGVDDADS